MPNIRSKVTVHVGTYPKEAVFTFSKKAALHLDPKFAGKLLRLKLPSITTIVVTGVSGENAKNVFDWIMKCCDKGRLQNYTGNSETPLTTAHFDLMVAEEWEMTYLIDQIKEFKDKKLARDLSP